MTIEEFQKAAAYVDAMHDENERLDKIMHAHKIVNEGKVEKLILLGTNIDGESVEVQMEIPKTFYWKPFSRRGTNTLSTLKN